MNDILIWMESSTLGQLMRDSNWLFAMAEIFHFIGLSLLLGSLLVIDFRLLGLSPNVSLKAVYKFLPIAIIGFAINLITGIMFCFTDPFRYYPNIAFRVKMLLIALAGLNALYYLLTTQAKSAEIGSGDTTATIKIVASLSLLFWFGVIIMGRLIPYLEAV